MMVIELKFHKGIFNFVHFCRFSVLKPDTECHVSVVGHLLVLLNAHVQRSHFTDTLAKSSCYKDEYIEDE